MRGELLVCDVFFWGGMVLEGVVFNMFLRLLF